MSATPSDPPGPTASHAGFRENLARSARVLVRHPWLPIVSLLLFALPAISSVSSNCVRAADGRLVCGEPDAPQILEGLAFIPLALFSLGWVGTERLWFLRAFRGRSITPREAWRFTWRFLGRYLVLVLLATPFALVYFGLSAATDLDFDTSVLLLTILAVPADVLATFVTPALAFTTKRVFEAIRIGWRMLREEWPASAWYAIVPPLAVLAIARAAPPDTVGTAARVAVAAVATLVNLWFKGATAAFYLERVPTPDNGAVGTWVGTPPRPDLPTTFPGPGPVDPG